MPLHKGTKPGTELFRLVFSDVKKMSNNQIEVNVFCPVCLEAFGPDLIPKFLYCGHRVCGGCATVCLNCFIFLFYNKLYFSV